MSFNKKDNKNLILNQITKDGSDNFNIVELVPLFSNEENDVKFLSHNDNIGWTSLIGSSNIIISNSSTGDIQIDCSIQNPLDDTPFLFRDGQVGLNRYPLHDYRFDISVPVNTRTTALHIGDGIFGISIGNATDSGFLPQIIGVGSDDDDSGLYFIGKVIEGENTDIPAIILDARNVNNGCVINRPILGISSGSYSDFKFLISSTGNVGIGNIPGIYKLNVDGNIKANNIIIEDSSTDINLKNEILILRERIEALEEK